MQGVLENTPRVLPERLIHLDVVEGDKEDAHGNESEDSLPADNLQRRRLEKWNLKSNQKIKNASC